MPVCLDVSVVDSIVDCALRHQERYLLKAWPKGALLIGQQRHQTWPLEMAA